jgi:hypothetical protein
MGKVEFSSIEDGGNHAYANHARLSEGLEIRKHWRIVFFEINLTDPTCIKLLEIPPMKKLGILSVLVAVILGIYGSACNKAGSEEDYWSGVLGRQKHYGFSQSRYDETQDKIDSYSRGRIETRNLAFGAWSSLLFSFFPWSYKIFFDNLFQLFVRSKNFSFSIFRGLSILENKEPTLFSFQDSCHLHRFLTAKDHHE